MLWKNLSRALDRGWIVTSKRLGDDTIERAGEQVKRGKRVNPHKLMKQLLKVQRKHHALVSKMLRRAQKFDLDIELGSKDIREAMKTLSAMAEVDLLRLPYPVVYFEATIDPHGLVCHARGDDLDSVRVGQLCQEQEDGSIRATVYGYRKDKQPTRRWCIHPVETVLRPDATLEAIQVREALGENQPDQTSVNYLLAVALVLLATKGVQRTHVAEKHPELLSRDKAVNGYTIVHVHPKEKKGEEQQIGGGQVAARHRVRLHLRRGHTRRQRYGPKLSRERKIWIEPTLVGYREEGVLRHDYAVESHSSGATN